MRMLVALAALSLHAFAAEYRVELKPETTRIQWRLSDVLHTVQGTFRLTRGKIDLNTSVTALVEENFRHHAFVLMAQ